jgi:flagellar biogenesis protein FliO
VVPIHPPEKSAGGLRRLVQQLGRLLRLALNPVLSPAARRLQLVEMQQLGEKRFVAILRVGGEELLIGGAAQSVSLLAKLDAPGATAIVAPQPRQERA